MNKKNLFVASVVLNVMLVIIIFMVKSNAAKQAQEYVKPIQEKASYQIAQVNDIIKNNNLLWELIDNIWKSPDKSKAFVKKLADSQKLPRCSGKPCEGENARLKTSVSSNEKDRSITVGWGEGRQGYKYWFKVIYDTKEAKDGKDKFLTIDASDLLGKSQEPAAEEEAEE
jgi:hypothetical protein